MMEAIRGKSTRGKLTRSKFVLAYSALSEI